MPLRPRASPFHKWRKNRLIKAESSFIALTDTTRYFGRNPSSATWHILFDGGMAIGLCGRRGNVLTSPGDSEKHITTVCSACTARLGKGGIHYVK